MKEHHCHHCEHRHEGEHEEHHLHEKHHKVHENHEGHHHEHHVEDFKRRFLVSLFLTLPILLLDSPFEILDVPFEEVVLTLLATIILVYGGKPFLEGALYEIKHRKPGMMTLVSLAILSGYLYSLLFQSLFWEMSTLIVVMLLGHWIEAISVKKAKEGTELLKEFLPAVVKRERGGEVEEVPLQTLKPGDIVIVGMGERIPVDGVIVEGSTRVDSSIITGESIPEKREKGDRVLSGELNLEGVIKVRVERVGKESYLGHVERMIEEAINSKTRIQDLADKVSGYLFYIAFFGGIGVFLYWLPIKGAVYALERMISVFVVACPHALGLAIPLVVHRASSLLALKGVVIRDKRVLEALPSIDYVLLDKTGTLTKGKPRVKADEETLRWAASVEQYVDHVIARAIVEEARKRGITLKEAREVNIIPGMGVEGMVEGKKVYVGLHDGSTVVVVDDRVIGVLEFEDELREDAKDVIEEIRGWGKKVLIVSGDKEEVTRRVAEYVGADGYFAGVKPHEKRELVRRLKEEGHRVMMVGDGVNDAPALAEADVGVAVASGTQIASITARVIISSLSSLPYLFRIGNSSLKRMKENLLWAFSYNIIAIPAAMGILGITISPALAALIMAGSTVIVSLNAMRM